MTYTHENGQHPEPSYPPPVVQRQALSAADREALAELLYRARVRDRGPVHTTSPEWEWANEVLSSEWLAEYVARHVTAALNKAADAIEVKRAAVLCGDRGLVDRLMLPTVGQVFSDAAAIVRALADDTT